MIVVTFGLRLAGSGKVISKMTYNLLSGALNTTNILSRIRILCGQIGMFLAVALCLGVSVVYERLLLSPIHSLFLICVICCCKKEKLHMRQQTRS